VFAIAGVPGRSLTFKQVAQAAHAGQGLSPGQEPGLWARHNYRAAGQAFPFRTHVAVVEVDLETGQVSIIRYLAVDDAGTVINPLLVEGQVHGGFAQGIGAALLEEIGYDEDGQLLSGSLLDYAMPRAADLPACKLAHTVTPSPNNPLGAKGVGEAGTVAAPAAIANAVLDALAPFGLTHLDIPLTAPKIWTAIRSAHSEGRG